MGGAGCGGIWVLLLKGCSFEPCVTLGSVASRGENSNPRSATSLDYLEIFVQQSFIKI